MTEINKSLEHTSSVEDGIAALVDQFGARAVKEAFDALNPSATVAITTDMGLDGWKDPMLGSYEIAPRYSDDTVVYHEDILGLRIFTDRV